MSENPVTVDHAAIAAEAERVALPPNTLAPGAESVSDAGGGAPPPAELQAPPASWAPLCPGIVSAVDLFVCPAWELTDREKAELADSLGPALDQLFPGGIGDERWAPYFRVLMVAAGITAQRYDRAAGKLKPLRASKVAKRASSEAIDDKAAGPFTIGAGVGSH